MKEMRILVTGGAGFIGSHTVKELIKAGYKEILVIDNLSKGKKEAVLAPAKLAVVDLKDKEALEEVFSDFKPEVVLHFAALKDAPESVAKPDLYYRENISYGLNLLDVMSKSGVKKIIFSSSAAVYGEATDVPITEKSATTPTNPYGWTKLMFEQILADYYHAFGINFVALRYFNAGGADIDGELGNQSNKREDLISVLMEVASGKREKFVINGTDCDTRDGSCIRDLVQVNDLAVAHVLAIDYLNRENEPLTVNLGSENGFSVIEAVKRTKELTGVDFLSTNGTFREGDVVTSIASSVKAKEILGWEPKYSDLDSIIRTAWGWEQKSAPVKK